jgi:5-carboxymethyl-2-hydroxymuconate isomerase
MPQITLEHTANLQPERNWNDLLGGLHDQIAGLAGIEIDLCKSRVLVLDTYHVGDGAKNKAFAHLTIRIFAGRSPAVKTELGRSGLALLKRYLGAVDDALDVQLTVEIRDIDREAYFKERLAPVST